MGSGLYFRVKFQGTYDQGFVGEIKYLGVVAIPYMWLVFALRYTGRDRWLITRKKTRLTLLAALPLATAVLALTNGMHHLLRSYEESPVPGMPPEVVHGPWFWVHASYSYLLLLGGTFLLLSTLLRHSRPYRGQWVAVAVGSLVPWVANAIYLLDVGVVRDLDPTPFGFTLTGGVLLWGCLRSRLLDLVPVARETIVEEMADGLIVADRYGRVLDTNRAAQSLLRLSESAAPGRELGDLLPTLSISSLLAAFQKTLYQREQEYQTIVQEVHLGEGRNQRWYELEISPLQNSSRVPVEGIIIVLRDITERKHTEASLTENQKRLSHQAFHDPLTGLPNRYLLENRLEERARRPCTGEHGSKQSGGSREGSRNESCVAILFMDLDGFKEVNDSLGHAAGDSLLRMVAERLEAGVRIQDTAARFGGDEFCVLLAGISGPAEAVQIAQRLGEALQKPFAIGTSTVQVSASIGVAVGGPDSEGRSLNELVREADAAMYRAKKKGGTRHEVVVPDGDWAG